MVSALKTVENNLNVSDWSLESGYKSAFGAEEFPIRMNDAGNVAAFSIQLMINKEDLEYKCRGIDQGFKVALTMPGEALTMSKRAIRVPLSEDTHIMIKPKLITSAEELRSYTPMQRQCFYNSERKLRFYKMYTQNSCEVECLANFTNIECGCVQFSMPSNSHLFLIQIFQFILN